MKRQLAWNSLARTVLLLPRTAAMALLLLLLLEEVGAVV
jgi:hypothetical protein